MSSELSETAPAPAPVARIYDKNKTVTVVSYNMERFAEDCVNVFCELSGYAKNKVGTAPTPFHEEANDPVAIFEGAPPKPKAKGKPSALAGAPKGKANESSELSETVVACTGALSKIACKVWMKIMYIARFARPDLLRAVGVLSTMITKWDTLCDRKFFRVTASFSAMATDRFRWRQPRRRLSGSVLRRRLRWR